MMAESAIKLTVLMLLALQEVSPLMVADPTMKLIVWILLP